MNLSSYHIWEKVIHTFMLPHIQTQMLGKWFQKMHQMWYRYSSIDKNIIEIGDCNKKIGQNSLPTREEPIFHAENIIKKLRYMN